MKKKNLWNLKAMQWQLYQKSVHQRQKINEISPSFGNPLYEQLFKCMGCRKGSTKPP